MGAISSRVLSRRKILSNATTERLSPKLQKKADKRAEKARKKGKPHLEITTDGYIHLVTASAPPPPKRSPTGKEKGKSRKSAAGNEDASSAATNSSRPQAHMTSTRNDSTQEEDSFYDDVFGLYSASCVASKELGNTEQIQFSILSFEQIRQRQQELIKRVAELLAISSDNASLMLLYFRWRLDDLVDAYRIDAERVCRESGTKVDDCAHINDPRDEEERQKQKLLFKRWPRSAPVAASLADSASNGLDLTDADGNIQRSALGIDRPPTPRRASGNRIQLQLPPVTRLVQQPADATSVEVITDETLAPYGIDAVIFNMRLAALQDIIALSDTQHSVQLLLGAGCDVNIATNHFFTQDAPSLQPLVLPPGAADGMALRLSGPIRSVLDMTNLGNSPSAEPSEALMAEFKVLDAEIEQMIAELEQRMNTNDTYGVETRKAVLQIARQSIRQPSGNRLIIGRQDNVPPATMPVVEEPSSTIVPTAASATSAPGDPRLRRAQRRDELLRLLNGEKVEVPEKELAELTPVPITVIAPASPAMSARDEIETVLLEPIVAPFKPNFYRRPSAPAVALPPTATDSDTAVSAPTLSTELIAVALAGPSAEEKAAHPGESLCPVCFCWTKDDECLSLECGHVYCRDCWAGHLMAKLSDGPLCLHARCMSPKCTFVVPVGLWRRAVNQPSFVRYESFLVKSFVDPSQSNTICWCPNPRSCELAVIPSADGTTGPPIAHCKCGYAFCWGCKEERHVPITCEQLNAWLQQCSREKASGVGEWVITNAKPCPGCKAPIEKNEGCMHMSCILCGHEFCWLCRAAWSTHGEQTGGYFACNRYGTSEAKAEDDDNENRKAQLRRFLHYYERYAQHNRSKEIAAKMLDEAPVRLQEYMNRNPTGTPISNFFLEAAKLAQDCRGVLKHTYAFAYFLPVVETPEKRLFEYLQANLEATTERLTELVEQPLEKVESGKLVNYTKATRKFLENMLVGLQSGLTYNQPFVELPPKKLSKQKKTIPLDSVPQQVPSMPEP